MQWHHSGSDLDVHQQENGKSDCGVFVEGNAALSQWIRTAPFSVAGFEKPRVGGRGRKTGYKRHLDNTVCIK